MGGSCSEHNPDSEICQEVPKSETLTLKHEQAREQHLCAWSDGRFQPNAPLQPSHSTPPYGDKGETWTGQIKTWSRVTEVCGPPPHCGTSRSVGLPVLPALDQVGVFAQHSFHSARLLLLQIHAAPRHGPTGASCSGRAAHGAGRARPGSELPRRRVRRGRVACVGPGMRTTKCRVHPGDGTVASSRRRGEE